MLKELLQESLVFIQDTDDTQINLNQSDLNDQQVSFKSKNNDISVTFKVKEKGCYLTLTISEWQGIADVPWRTLHWEMQNPGFHLTELDYMTSLDRGTETPRISWGSPAHHFGVNTCGAFAAFQADNDEEHDEILLNIWVNENQPHPEFLENWNLETAKEWLSKWQEKFTSRSQMVVNAKSLQELYDLVPYAEKADIDEIYIFTNTWRPDAFWPMTDVNWALNKKVFPNGREDLRAYSAHLAERGMRLNMHYVSGGFGLHDPVYIGKNPHSQLAVWGTGKLLQDIDQATDKIKVSGNDGLQNPMFAKGHFNAVVIQIGNEIIVVDKKVTNEDGTLNLSDCQRGSFNTDAADHSEQDKVKFLVVPYAQNFVPDNDSELLYEVADNFASLLNDCNIAHAEFDGAEIHCYTGNYGYVKFAQRIYEKTNHAITSHDSSGSAARCFFEYRFKKTQELFKGTCRFTHGNWLVPFQIDSPSRPAATILDAQFFLSQGHFGGAQGMSKPEPMFGITTDMLAQHGLTEQFLKTLHSWKEISKQLTDEQHQMIEASLSKPNWPMPDASNHRIADTIYTVEEQEGKYSLVPVQTMCRETGDIKWSLGQEYGPISPRQFIQPDDELELINNYEAQTPDFVIRVLPAFDPNNETITNTEAFTSEGQVFDKKDFFVEGNEPGSENNRDGVLENINLLSDGSVVLQDKNNNAESKYQVRELPEWNFRADLSNHTGIAMEVEGDSSGALVVVQLEGQGCRDFVFPIDFTGTKTIVVPSSEVAWSRADWGWRMGVKCMDYAQVKKCHLGLGMIPAGKNVSIKINKVTALAKKPVKLKNPIIEINDTRMQIEGDIATGNYIHYKDGDQVEVFDPNWHLVEKLRIPQNDLQASKGPNKVRIDSGTTPWLECQFFVKGEPMAVLGKIAK